MLLAVMSDSHDHIDNLRKAVSLIRERGAEMIVHCGDLVAPFMLPELAEAGVPVHAVFGNNDGDHYLLTRFSLTKFTDITFHGLFGRMEAGGRNVAFTHYREAAEGLFRQGADLVFFGHTHVFFEHREDGRLLLNPGEIMGKEGEPGFCFVDTKTREVERVRI